jgi:hypothetical protein
VTDEMWQASIALNLFPAVRATRADITIDGGLIPAW